MSRHSLPAANGIGGAPTVEQITQALAGVNDPEIHRPITELGMVKHVEVAADGTVLVEVWLTVAGCAEAAPSGRSRSPSQAPSPGSTPSRAARAASASPR